MTELLPCPFCGNLPNDVALGVAYQYVACHHVDCDVRPQAKYYRKTEDVVGVWNRRAEPAPLTDAEKREAIEVMAQVIATSSAGYPDEQKQAEEAITVLLEKFDIRKRG